MKQPNITAVTSAGQQTVEITWASGKTDRVDLAALVADLTGLASLDNASTFSAVHVGEDGWSLIWPNGAEIGTDTLQRMVSYYEAGRWPDTENGGLGLQGLLG